jgi:hypothetical protein
VARHERTELPCKQSVPYPPSDLLSTPDPDRFPLTTPYAADGTRLRPGAVYIRESERDQGAYSFDTQYERARDVLLRNDFYVAMVRVDSKTGSKISRTGYKDVEASRTQRFDCSRWRLHDGSVGAPCV